MIVFFFNLKNISSLILDINVFINELIFVLNMLQMTVVAEDTIVQFVV